MIPAFSRPLLAAPLFASLAFAQSAVPAGDINTDGEPGGSFLFPQGLMVGDVLYYQGYTLAHGAELWRTDGTAAGTYMVADIFPGPVGSAPSAFAELGGNIVFAAQGTGTGREPWITDGTAAGTQLIQDIYPGPTPSLGFPEFVTMGGHVYFGATNQQFGNELWRTDGTSGGTQVVHDLTPGPGSSAPGELTLAPTGAQLVFTANVNGSGREPCISDGSPLGTKLLLDIAHGGAASFPHGYKPFGSQVIFAASDASFGQEAWITDGTTAGTTRISDLNPGIFDSNPATGDGVEWNGEFYFKASEFQFGEELWKTDGTLAGTQLVRDLFPGSGSSNPLGLTLFNGDLYFGASAVSDHNLWRINGATGLFEKVLPSGDPKAPLEMAVSNGLLFFSGIGAGVGREPYVTDGTEAGTMLLKDIIPGPDGSAASELYVRASGGVVFGAKDPMAGLEPWFSDGTPAGTQVVLDAEPSFPTDDSDPEGLTPIGGKQLYFSADDGVIGRELYRWTKASGIELIMDLAPGLGAGFTPKDSNPRGFVQAFLNGAAHTYFLAETGASGKLELWKTNGQTSGTEVVANIDVDSFSTGKVDLTPALGMLFFAGATNGGIDREVWTSDGTAAGTAKLVDLVAGNGSSFPQQFTEVAGKVVFQAKDASGDIELYMSDGTAARTELLLDIGVGFSSRPDRLTRVGDRVAFVVNRSSGGVAKDLWVTNGSKKGTQLVSTVGTAGYAGVLGELVAWGDKLLFHGHDDVAQGLFVSDLTAAGTVPLYTPSLASEAKSITPVGDRIYFLMDGDVHVHDTVTGVTTRMTDAVFENLFATSMDSQPLDDGFVFAPTNHAAGGPFKEIYFTDGTAQNTGVVFDVTPETPGQGTGSELESNPEQLVWVDGDLLFVAEQPSGVGREVFRAIAAGGYVADLGLSSSGHSIASGPALIGQPVTVTGQGAPVGTSYLGFGPSLALPHGNLVVPGDVAWLNPGASVVAAITTTPSWSFTLNVPPVLALVGAQFNLQSWTFNGTFPAQTSNGLQFVIGQ